MLAIDPGPKESAYVLTKGADILLKEKIPNGLMLAALRTRDFQAEPLAIEMIASYGMAVGAEVFETCVWIGRFIQAHNGQRRLVTRMEVKMHVCHSSKGNDGAVRQALIDRFGEPGTKRAPGMLYGFSGDLWQALGVAVTATETRGTWRQGNE